MRTCIFIIVAFFISFNFYTGTAQAQQRKGFHQGNWEVTFVGSGTSDEDLDGTVLSTEAGIGYFFKDNLEFVVRQGVSYFERPGDDDWAGSTRAAIDLCFGKDLFYPFIGAGVGYLYGDAVKEQFVAGPEAGIKFLASDSTFLFGLVEYEFLFGDADDIDDNYEHGRFVYSLGIGFTF